MRTEGRIDECSISDGGRRGAAVLLVDVLDALLCRNERLPELLAGGAVEREHRHARATVVRRGEEDPVAPHDRGGMPEPGHWHLPLHAFLRRPLVPVLARLDDALP